MTARGCAVPGCAGRHTARGYCATHYRRWQRHGDPTRGWRPGPRCEVPSCDRARYGRGYCHAHYERWRRHGDPRADIPIEAKTTGGVGYWAAHQRVRAERGPATGHACAECGAPARDWSYDGADPDERVQPDRGYRYSLDPDRYRPRCRSCHRRATLVRRRPRPASPPVLDVEHAARLYRAGASARGIAAHLGTSRTAVYTALRAHGVPIRPRGTRAPRHVTDDPGEERDDDLNGNQHATSNGQNSHTHASRSSGAPREPWRARAERAAHDHIEGNR